MTNQVNAGMLNVRYFNFETGLKIYKHMKIFIL